MKKIAAYLTGCVLAFCLASCGIESVSKTDATASLEINNGVCAPTSLSMNSNETTALKITNIGTTNATFSIRDIQLSVSDISAGKSKQSHYHWGRVNTTLPVMPASKAVRVH
jgi:hypothetical protein